MPTRRSKAAFALRRNCINSFVDEGMDNVLFLRPRLDVPSPRTKDDEAA